MNAEDTYGAETRAETSKRCFGCKELRPLTEFRENAAMPSGRNAWCDVCSPPPAARKPAEPRPRKKMQIDMNDDSNARRFKGDLRPTRTVPRESTAPRVLVLNTYAGSLLIGARAAGLTVMGSYEDAGFGQEFTVKNFPDLDGLFASKREHWPEHDLSGDIAIAHPPCAAFSNLSWKSRPSAQAAGEKFGIESPHFKCTVDVADYAMGHRVAALAIESVRGACEGGRAVHDAIAARHGYDVFRVLLNSATFGVPQWRPRFWVIFVRSDVGGRMAFDYAPRVMPLGLALDQDPGQAFPKLSATVAAQTWWLRHNGLDADALMRTPGSITQVVANALDRDATPQVGKEYSVRGVGSLKQREDGQWENLRFDGFTGRTTYVLDPAGTAPTLMHYSVWAYDGRAVTPAEYRAIMGFPRDYALDGAFRLYLSKGVCPPVAQWVLEQMAAHVRRRVYRVGEDDLPDRVVWKEAGEVLDLQVTRRQWDEMAGVPPRAVAERAPRDPAAPPRERKAPPTGSATPVNRRKKRVEQTYVLTREAGAMSERDFVDAFTPHRDVVLVPLKDYRLSEDGIVGTAIVQYEPPNAGGSLNDTDRIAARAARTLGATWRRA